MSLFLLIAALSGGALLYKEDLLRLQHPELAEPVARVTAFDHAAALQAIGGMIEGPVKKIEFPRPGQAAYVVSTGGGGAIIHQRSHERIVQWRHGESMLDTITELHIHLAVGKSGQRLVGAVGVVAALMILSGLYLWWPRRRRFRIGHLLPHDTRRASLLPMHRDLGAVAGLLLLMFVLTGAGLAFYSTTRAMLNGLFSEHPPLDPKPAIRTGRDIGMPSAGAIAAAQSALPGARLISYQPPPIDGAVHRFRLRQIGEWHPYGRSQVQVNPVGDQVIAVVDATQQPAGERFAHALYPLHAAKVGGPTYRLLALLAAIVLGVISTSGAVSYVQARRQAKARTIQ